MARRRTGAVAPESVGGLIARIAARFERAGLAFGHGTHDAADEAAWLVVHALGIDFDALATRYSSAVEPAVAGRAESIADQRVGTRKPLAYLLNEAWLGEHRFYVDERVIVPRSFIAELLRRPRPPWAGTPQRILDMCTGSGCLAIVAAHRYPDARVDAVDLSDDALAVARRNIDEHRLGARVRAIRSDLFRAVAAERYDLILTNPPYVDAPAMQALPAEYRHEPAIALAAGRDGLALVDRIVRSARRHLHPHGVLVLELGHVRAAFERAWPALPVRWQPTSAGRDLVFAIDASALPPATGRATRPNREPASQRSPRRAR